MLIERITAEKTLNIRKAILRPTGTIDDVRFPLDNHTETLHVGIFANDHLVGVSSIYHIDPEGDQSKPWWQIRGMAVLDSHRRQGLGSKLIGRCVDYVRAQNAEMVWCNARMPYLDFYRTLGFEASGEEFDIPGAGPHYYMEMKL